MNNRKGIILAGGLGTRLYPITICTSKQLLPVYDKPMIYYPISVLMLSGIKEILLITSQKDLEQFKSLLHDGSHWGIKIYYKIQPKPEGLAQALILAEDFLNGCPSILILGDNIFFGNNLSKLLIKTSNSNFKCTIFGYHVENPERYGVINFKEEKLISIEEKPLNPKSNLAIPGLYFFDNSASLRAKKIKPSKRGELEIIDLIQSYLEDKSLNVEIMGRSFKWFDTGTQNSLLEASNFIGSIFNRQRLIVGSPDEVALRLGFIDKKKFSEYLSKFNNNIYFNSLKKLIE
jgi:glucose-1-phosphate thymidylyltransferase